MKLAVFHNKLNKKINWISEFNVIKSLIPNDWKRALHEEVSELEIDSEVITFSKPIDINHSAIKVDKKEIDFKKVKQKDLITLHNN